MHIKTILKDSDVLIRGTSRWFGSKHCDSAGQNPPPQQEENELGYDLNVLKPVGVEALTHSSYVAQGCCPVAVVDKLI